MEGITSIFDLFGYLDGFQGNIKIMIFRLDLRMEFMEESIFLEIWMGSKKIFNRVLGWNSRKDQEFILMIGYEFEN